MGWQDYIVILILVLCAAAAIAAIRRKKKKSPGACVGCTGDCFNCTFTQRKE
ncbi:MAG: FeoB-associated Cys-rich membrane protein [Acutalibacteraceae bacterium]|jgi:hypothetical protein